MSHISEHYVYHLQCKMPGEMYDTIKQVKFIIMYVQHWSNT